MRRLLPWAVLVLAVGVVALGVAILLRDEVAAGLPSSVLEPSTVVASPPDTVRDPETDIRDADTRVDLLAPTDGARTEVASSAKVAPIVYGQRGRVAGRILGGWNGDSPLAEASVAMWRSRSRDPRELVTRTDANGNFVLEDVAFAYWFAEMSAPGHRAVRVIVPVTREEPTAAPVARLPFLRDFGVNLVDATGPVTSVERIGLRPALAPALTLGIGPREARSQEELKSWQKLGSFPGPSRLDENDSPTWRVKCFTQFGDCLHVLLGPHVVASHPLGEVTDVIEIPVDRHAIQAALTRVSVRVLANDGKAIADARVEFRFRGTVVEDVAVDSQGVAVLHDVPHVQLAARARSPRHVPASIDAQAGDEPHDIQLITGFAIAGSVEAPVGKPGYEPVRDDREPGSRVGLWRVDPETTRIGQSIQTRPLRDGRFEFDAVLPGTYAISCAIDSMANLHPETIVERTPNHVVVVQVTNVELRDVVVPWIEEVLERESLRRKSFTGRKEGGGR